MCSILGGEALARIFRAFWGFGMGKIVVSVVKEMHVNDVSIINTLVCFVERKACQCKSGYVNILKL